MLDSESLKAMFLAFIWECADFAKKSTECKTKEAFSFWHRHTLVTALTMSECSKNSSKNATMLDWIFWAQLSKHDFRYLIMLNTW